MIYKFGTSCRDESLVLKLFDLAEIGAVDPRSTHFLPCTCNYCSRVPFLALFFFFFIKITHIAAEFVAVGFRVKSGSKSHVMLLNMQLCMCVGAASHAQRRADSVDGRVTCVRAACRLRTNAVIALS